MIAFVEIRGRDGQQRVVRARKSDLKCITHAVEQLTDALDVAGWELPMDA
jgi:hypothetical protein